MKKHSNIIKKAMSNEGIPRYHDGRPSYFGGHPSYHGGRPSYYDGCPSNHDGHPSYYDGCPSHHDGHPSHHDGRPWFHDGRPSHIEKRPSRYIILFTADGKSDFIPRGNPEFDPWQNNFVIKTNGYISGWHISVEGMDEWDKLTGAGNVKQARWVTAWGKVSSKQFTKSDELEMKEARKNYESGDRKNPDDTSIRIWITRYVRHNKHVTNEQKSQCGLTVPKDHNTDTNADTVKSVENAVMVVSLKDSKHLFHNLKVTQNKKSVAKGKDVLEISMYIAFTAANIKVSPAISTFAYDGAITRGLYPRTFDASQEGLRAWYIARKKYKGKAKKIGVPSRPTSGIVG